MPEEVEGRQDSRHWGNITPENYLEYKQYIIDPSSTEFFKDINKDIVLSNLTEWEIWFLRQLNELIGLADEYHWKKTSDFLLRKSLIVLATARSRKGWQQEMLATDIKRAFLQDEGEGKKNLFNIGFGGRRKE